METKIGSNPFPQRAMNVREKTSGVNTTDPLAMKKQFGEQSLEQVLNSVADPNYQGKTRKVPGVGNPDLDKDAFLKLMLTQLQQQDPTNPMKSHEMAAQLAQFTSVEQLTNINENIKKMGQGSNQAGQYDVLALIGKQVSGDSSLIDRKVGEKTHNLEFNLPQDATEAKISIKDEKGTVVRTYNLNQLKAGPNQLAWNGLQDDGKDAPVGTYTVQIDAHKGGQKMMVQTKFEGAVDGVQFTSKGPVLMVGGKTLNLRDVKAIQVPQGPATQPQAENRIQLDEKESKGAVVAAKPDDSLLSANIDRELKNKLTN